MINKEVAAHLSSLLARIPLPAGAPSHTLILGLSGGPDSVFLAHALAALASTHNLTIIAVHINHQWRTSADNDQQFCIDKANDLSFACHIEQAPDWHHALPPHKVKNSSAESLAREVRRAVFASYKQKYTASAIMLAHHADDQVETFLIRAIRGASSAGLGGMAAWDGTYARPLIDTPKHDIMAWLDAHNHQYCIDPTNTSDAHLRNRLRSHVLPALAACDQRAHTMIRRTMHTLREESAYLDALAHDTITNLSDADGWVPCTAFFAAAPGPASRPLQVRMIQHLLIAAGTAYTPSAGLFDEIISFLSSPRGGSHTINTLTILKKSGRFCIKKGRP